MSKIILFILSLVVLKLVILATDAVLSLSIKYRVQKNLKSMKITTKRAVQEENIKLKKTQCMLNGSLVANQYDLYNNNFVYHIKGSNELLDSLNYDESVDNYIKCRIYVDILVCNNIEINSLKDIYKAFGLKDNEAIDFDTPLWRLLASNFMVIDSIEYNGEIIISDGNFNLEDWIASMNNELKDSLFIKKWLFMPVMKYLRFRNCKGKLDFKV